MTTGERCRIACGSALLLMGCGAKALTLPDSLSPPPCAEQGQVACEAACEAGDGHACLAASARYNHDPRHIDREKMMALELTGCELGFAQACHWYGNNFTKEDPKRARQYFLRACEGGHLFACVDVYFDLLELTEDGMSGERAGREFAQSLCDAEILLGCAILADLSALGVGGPRDIEGAATLYRRACAERASDTCHNAESLETEITLHAANRALLQWLHFRDPAFTVHGAPSDWEIEVAAQACFDPSSSVPARVDLVKPSGNAEIDAIAHDAAGAWRARVRTKTPPGVLLCHRVHWQIKTGS
jgi:hypothetical protein